MLSTIVRAAALGLALAGGSAQAAPDLAKMTGGELAAFTRAMPKGGELHNHMGGSTFAESWITWAVQGNLCIDMKTVSVDPPCQPGGDLKPAAAALTDEAVRAAVIDSFSVRHPGFMGRSGHDQFFTAFGRFGLAGYGHEGDIIADAMDTLARQNTFYLEAMVTPQGLQSRVLGGKAGWQGGDLAAQKAADAAQGLAALVPAAIAETDAFEARAREVLKCGTPEASPGCQVTVRYLMQANRQGPPEQTFAQLDLGVALISADKRWVGLQLVAPEDSVPATEFYALHMRMVDFLTDHGRKVPVALHAGEVTLKLVPPSEVRSRVGQAVRVAGARRIGHGVDIAGEDGAEALAAEMAAKGVMVEVNLSSNAAILEVSGKEHPYGWLRQRGVPTSLSTDDAGILRIDLSHEYARAAGEGASYDDLKTSARNAIAFSFLTGAGLWDDPGTYRKPAPACAGQIGEETAKPGACADLIRTSDKAREQWRHEHLLKQFEARP